MNWTQSDKDFVTEYIKQFGKADIAALSFHLKSRTGKPFTTSDVRTLVKLVTATAPKEVTPTIVLKKDSTPGNVKEVCRQIINDFQKELHAIARIDEPLFRKVPPTKLVPLLFLSDLHIGEIIEVDGKVVFDQYRAECALRSVVRQTIEAPELKAYETEGLVVILGGDIIEGELIYPAQGYQTTGDAFTQSQVATRLLWSELLTLRKYFPWVEVYCVPGNHGRSSKLHSQMSNWDNVIYHNLRLLAEMSNCKIIVNTPNQMWMDFQIHQWTVHTRHIGVVQASSGSSAKKVMTWMNNHDADLLFFGHYHSPEMFSCGYKRIFKNGALPPANDFAENLGFQDSPGQWLVGVTHDNPVAFSKVIIPKRFEDEDDGIPF